MLRRDVLLFQRGYASSMAIVVLTPLIQSIHTGEEARVT